MLHTDFFSAKKDRLPQKSGAKKDLACRAATADAVVIPAAAQQQNDPDPRAVAPAIITAAIVVAAQAQQNDDPDDAVVVTIAKSTHNKNTSLR